MDEQKISIDEVKRVATLCRLDFDSNQLEKLRGDLSQILDYVASLDEVETKDIEPTFFVLPEHNVFRKDVISDSLKREDVLAGAKDKDMVYIRTGIVL